MPSDVRAAQITRLSMSRPSGSVPSRCAEVPPPSQAGGFSRFANDISLKPYGATNGAASATAITSTSKAAPTQPVRTRASRRSVR